ncbi:MAG: TonB-dependent Receptor Plug domain-containing protein, partial [bacterium]
MKKKTSSFKNRLIGSLATLLLTTGLSFGQSDTGRVEGTVTDPTGAAVAGVTVVVTNIETNSRIEITTNEQGNYVAPTLRVGTYRVEFSAQGFRKNIQNDITLTVSQIAQINAQLDTGEITDVIEISSNAPLVETSSSSLGQVIEGKQIVDLPINGRNFTQLATLVPGVSRGTPGSNADGSGGNAETFRQGDTGSAAISANGLREQNNNFLLDGIDNNESIVNTIVFFPPIEALQEFRVITSVAPAEFGRGGGAVINAITKSGSNEIHGTVFELLRNSELDARATFAPTKPIFQRNQFGFAFGAPIKKNRTFFFGNYQGLRQNLPKEEGNRVTVPTSRMRQGDFGELLNADFTGLGQPITIFDPVTGNPFPRNIITRPLDPVAVRYLNSFPLPEIAGRATQNYFVKRIAKQTFNDGDFRIDHRFNDTNTIFGRFSIADDSQNDPGRIPGFQAGFGAGLNTIEARGVASGYTHTFSPNAVNEFRFGFTLLRIGFFPVNFGQNQNQTIGIGGLGAGNTNTGISLIGGGNGNFIEYLGDGGQFTLRERSYQISDALTYIKGNNTLKFGFVTIRRNVKAFQGDFAKGFYSFSDFAATPGNKPPLGQTGYEVADMLAGRTSFTSITASLTG